MPHHYHEQPDATRVAPPRRPELRRRRLPLWMGSEGAYGGIDGLLGGVLPGGKPLNPLEAAMTAADAATPAPVRAIGKGVGGLGLAGMFGPMTRRGGKAYRKPTEHKVLSTGEVFKYHDIPGGGRVVVDFGELGDKMYEMSFDTPGIRGGQHHKVMSRVASAFDQFVRDKRPKEIGVFSGPRKLDMYERLLRSAADKYGGDVTRDNRWAYLSFDKARRR